MLMVPLIHYLDCLNMELQVYIVKFWLAQKEKEKEDNF